jgi:hypothetical protein
MREKYLFILGRAVELQDRNQRLTVTDLAAELNAAGFRAGDGKPFAGQRGTYALLSRAYNWCESTLGEKAARIVAFAFTTPDGAHAWN